MPRKYLLAGAIAVVGVLAVGVPIAGAAEGTATTRPGARTITCSIMTYNQTPNQLSGFTFGYISCPKPFGNGVQSGTYSVTVTATGAVIQKGTFTSWFDTGTTHGTYSLIGRYTSATAATFKGTATDTGGTGAFRRINATGPLTCSTTDAGAASTCTRVATLSGL